VNEYVTKFTQLSCYTRHEVNTDEKRHDCFLNGWNDGLAYALEARDFENFQGMVSKALVLENHKGVMERVTPSFKAKPNAQSTCAQESRLHAYHTESGYRITNVSI
jgi:hypothetical protein